MKLNMRNKKIFVQNVFDQVFDKYDLMNDIMSLGTHRLWKKQLINWLSPTNNKKLLDMASGTGDLIKLFINHTNDNSQIYAVDQNTQMINIGKKKLRKYKNIHWKTGRAEKLNFKDNFFDYYTISFGIRNVSNINSTLKEAYRVLKPGGRFMCLEFSKIENNHLNKLYKLYSRNIPKIGEIIAGNRAPYEYLLNSINDFFNQDEFIDLMKKNNFYKTEYRNLSGGIVAIFSGWKI